MNAKSSAILGGCVIVAALIVIFVPRLLPESTPAKQAKGDVVPNRREIVANQRATYFQAYNHNDAKTIAGLYSPDADFIIETGEVLHGREAVEKFFTQVFARNKGIQLTPKRASDRFVTPEVLVEDGSFELAPRQDGGVTQGRYTTVWVYGDGQWLLYCHRSWVPIKEREP